VVRRIMFVGLGQDRDQAWRPIVAFFQPFLPKARTESRGSLAVDEVPLAGSRPVRDKVSAACKGTSGPPAEHGGLGLGPPKPPF